jgi:hypothetical protein
MDDCFDEVDLLLLPLLDDLLPPTSMPTGLLLLILMMVAAVGASVGDDDDADPTMTESDIDEDEEGGDVDASIQNSWSVDTTSSLVTIDFVKESQMRQKNDNNYDNRLFGGYTHNLQIRPIPTIFLPIP